MRRPRPPWPGRQGPRRPRPPRPGHGDAPPGSPSATRSDLPRARPGRHGPVTPTQPARSRGPEAFRAALTARASPRVPAGPTRASLGDPALAAVCTAAARRPGTRPRPSTPSVSPPLTVTAHSAAAASNRLRELGQGSEGASCRRHGRRTEPRAGPDAAPPSPCAGGDRPVPYRRAWRPVADGATGPDSPSRDHAASTAPVPQASTVPPMRGSRGTRSGALPGPHAWSPSPGPLRFGTCPPPPEALRHRACPASAPALHDLALAPRCVGGTIGLGGGWPPWTRAGTILPWASRRPAGGRASDGRQWRPSGHMSWGLSRRWPPGAGQRARCRAHAPVFALVPTTSGHGGGCLVTGRPWITRLTQCGA